MSALTVIYVLFTSIGIAGVGYYFWSFVKARLTNPSAKSEYCENLFLTIGISWFLGYFVYESVLSFLSVCQLFYPPIIILTGLMLSAFGSYYVYTHIQLKGVYFKINVEMVLLVLMVSFVLFWNLYPTYDVDSLAHYFAYIKNLLADHGKSFSRFDDVRLSFPLGENFMYALGLAYKPNSTVFAQLIQGFSKVAVLLGVYGACQMLGLGVFSLIAPAMFMSEPHFIASGANGYVHINIPFLLAIFFMVCGLLVYVQTQKKDYLLLSYYAGLVGITCKYYGLVYLFILIVTLGLFLFFHRKLCKDFFEFFKKKPAAILFVAIPTCFALIPYISNWILTGTPIFPATLGPLVSGHYDAAALEASRLWHYHLSVSDAFKTFSGFLVWPGVLASKILVPLVLMVSFVQILSLRPPSKTFLYGISFFALSVVVILITQLFFVYEMRYYRFGMGIYVLACTCLFAALFELLFEQFKLLSKWSTVIGLGFVILLNLYCFRYSFDLMGFRASPKDIVAFVTHAKSESEIFETQYTDEKRLYEQLTELNINPKELGLLVEANWPQALYLLEGRRLMFLMSSSFESYIYFDKGLLAKKLNDLNIKYIFNSLNIGEDYPFKGGVFLSVLNQCATKRSDKVFELSSECLSRLALQGDRQKAEEKLKTALKGVKSRPKYDPFNRPGYGGYGGVIN